MHKADGAAHESGATRRLKAHPRALGHDGASELCLDARMWSRQARQAQGGCALRESGEGSQGGGPQRPGWHGGAGMGRAASPGHLSSMENAGAAAPVALSTGAFFVFLCCF